MKYFSMKVIIVDDEPLARRRIRALLNDYADVRLVAECANGAEAIAAIEEHAPDLMFLDVQMPEMDGLSVIGSRGGESLPLIIFVTAYDQYGLAAFDSHAVDYLLKPFDRKRFSKAMEKARARLSEKSAVIGDLSDIVSRIELRPHYPKHVSIRQDGRIFLIKTETIEWIAAEKNYVRFHVGGRSYLRRETIGNVGEKLDPDQFRRVHRSAIVNIAFIKELRIVSGGDYKIVLLNEIELVLGSTYQKNLPEFLS
jgi:two-component system, LytTR family, response regulator